MILSAAAAAGLKPFATTFWAGVNVLKLEFINMYASTVTHLALGDAVTMTLGTIHCYASDFFKHPLASHADYPRNSGDDQR